MVVKNGEVFMTASNPNLDAMGNNRYLALVRASLSGSSVLVEPVLDGNATIASGHRAERRGILKLPGGLR